MNRHALTDEEWQIIEARIPRRFGPASKLGDRNFVDAVVWLARTGAPWRDLDSDFGPWKTIYNRFRDWVLRGWWKDIFRGTTVDEEAGSILDGSVVRAHQDAAGGDGGPSNNAIGRSRGGFSTKLHAVVTISGQPIELRATPGQQHEATIAEELLDFVHGRACLAKATTPIVLSKQCDTEISQSLCGPARVANAAGVTIVSSTNYAIESKSSSTT